MSYLPQRESHPTINSSDDYFIDLTSTFLDLHVIVIEI